MKRYDLVLTSKFKKALKLAKKRGVNINLLDEVVEKLQNGIPLEEKYHDHELKGKYKVFRECHVQPDWLLKTRMNEKNFIHLFYFYETFFETAFSIK